MIKAYYKLTKPGIIMGNAITAIGGFLLASKGSFDGMLFTLMLLGLCSIIASGCVCNNYFDIKIDEKMARTKERALVTGEISAKKALIFASALLVVGSVVLALGTNFLTLRIALTGFAVYVFAYTPLKTRSEHGTLIGSIAGAVPPVVGYCAVSGHFNTAALLLFTIVALWQMPHFYAIALYRIDEYRAAQIPVLPLVKGQRATKKQIFYYTLAFLIAALLPTLMGYTGLVYLAITGAACLCWLYIALKGFSAKDDTAWAKGMFRASLLVIMAFSIMISIDTL